ncbi:MAG: hypothetical protein PUC32_01765 [Oscillospiraceae bacterium]|nr:hypothetical protein [Oscillospiraceae bacterium]
MLLLCCICLSAFWLSGCGTKDITGEIDLDRVYEANKTSNLLQNHRSIRQTVGSEDFTVYIDRERYFYELGDDYRQLVGDDFSFVYYDGKFSGVLYADSGKYRETYTSIFLTDSFREETLVSATDDGTQIHLKTQYDAKQDEPDLGLSKGDHCDYVYVLDSKTYELIEGRQTLTDADGKMTVDYRSKITYDTPLPKEAAEMEERSKPDTDLRTLTVVLDPNTKKEKVYSRTVRKGDYFSVVIPDGYTMYEDEDCTIPYEEDLDDNEHHLLLFAKPSA